MTGSYQRGGLPAVGLQTTRAQQLQKGFDKRSSTGSIRKSETPLYKRHGATWSNERKDSSLSKRKWVSVSPTGNKVRRISCKRLGDAITCRAVRWCHALMSFWISHSSCHLDICTLMI